MSESPWPLIHAERQALLEDLVGLSPEQWATPSLCSQWSVRQVFGHMTATARMSPGRFIGKFAKAGFVFDKMTAADVAAETAGTPDQQVAAFRSLAGATSAPPGPVDAMLGEAVVHSADLRRPLGIKREYPLGAVIRAADFYAGSNLLIGAKKRIDGVRLRATDTDWSHGSGPEVTGPALALLQAMTGRGAALEDLAGPGLDTLRSRF
jgi:uncharacterized protein (TIGR03083 family)